MFMLLNAASGNCPGTQTETQGVQMDDSSHER